MILAHRQSYRQILTCWFHWFGRVLGIMNAIVVLIFGFFVICVTGIHKPTRFSSKANTWLSHGRSSPLFSTIHPAAFHDRSSDVVPPTPPWFDSFGSSSDDNHAPMLMAIAHTTNHTLRSLPSHPPSDKVHEQMLHIVAKWWKQFTVGQRGLLLVLLPALTHQISILRAMVPFVVERLSQYVHPPATILISLAVLRRSWGVASNLRGLLWLSVLAGAALMVYDSFRAGPSWQGMQPSEDSYALVTGAGDGLGRELSKRLYHSGYNLVLVDDDEPSLQQLQSSLVEGENTTSPDSGNGFNEDPTPDGLEYFPGWIYGLRDAGNRALEQLRARAHPVLLENLQWIQQNVGSAGVEDAEKSSNATQLGRIQAPTRGPVGWWALSPPSLTNGRTANCSNRTDIVAQRRGAVHTISVDFAHSEAAEDIYQHLQHRGVLDKVEVLIHAAERNLSETMVDTTPVEDLQQTLQARASFPVSLTRLLLPHMLARCRLPRAPGSAESQASSGGGSGESGSSGGSGGGRAGRVVFVNSLCPTVPAPRRSVAAACEAFVSTFAQSLRREVLHKGVLVTVAHCGPLRGRGAPTMTASTPPKSSAQPFQAPEEDGEEFEGQSRVEDPPATACEERRATFLDLVPVGRLSVEEAAAQIHCAACAGRDAITPGLGCRLYRHGVTALLPTPVLSMLHQMAQSPVPRWADVRNWRLPNVLVAAPPLPLPSWQSSGSAAKAMLQEARDKARVLWEQTRSGAVAGWKQWRSENVE